VNLEWWLDPGPAFGPPGRQPQGDIGLYRPSTAQLKIGKVVVRSVAPNPLRSLLNIWSEPDVWSRRLSQGRQAAKYRGQPELFYASGRDVAQIRQNNV
jgi:hypothetical protein